LVLALFDILNYSRSNIEFNLRKATLIGCASGALAQFIASPTDLVKVIMQAEGKRKLEGHKPR
jgi:solute carrier family 25 uncoupling protein 27